MAVGISELLDQLNSAGVTLGDPRAMGSQQPFVNQYLQEQVAARYGDKLGKLDNERAQKIQQLAEVDRTLTKLYRDPNSKFYTPNVSAVEGLRNKGQNAAISDIGITDTQIQATQKEMEDEIKQSQALFQDLIGAFKDQESAITTLEGLSSDPVFTQDDFDSLSEADKAGKLKSAYDSNVKKNGNTILPSEGPITQLFGNRNSGEIFSKGVNYGVDIAVPTNTPVSVPEGQWKVVQVFNKNLAQGPNNKNRSANSGYGNSVLVENTQTGERIRLSHLSRASVNQGDVISGGTRVGYSGATGNVLGKTGQHLDIEYYDSNGRIRDILNSAYASYLFG